MTRKKSRPIAQFMAGLLWAGMAQAQESVNASGGHATSIGGTVSYSVGQVAYTTNQGSGGIIAHGVQQVYEIFTVGVKEAELNISLSVFPNPATDNVTIQISNYNNEQLSYQLCDMQGKVLNNGKVTAQQTLINTSSLPLATYFINIVNPENRKVQSFKIIKK